MLNKLKNTKISINSNFVIITERLREARAIRDKLVEISALTSTSGELISYV